MHRTGESMNQRSIAASLFWPTVLSVVGLAVLISLGTWQLQRKAEKEALISLIENRRTGEAVELATLLAQVSLDDADYQRVKVTGRFVAGKARFYYAPQPQLGPGFDVYEPLEYAEGQVVWVNRGFIPQRIRDTAAIWQSPSGEVTIVGNARLPAKPGAFTPDNDAEGNNWYWRDLAGMQRSAFDPGAGKTAAGVFVVAEPEQRLTDVDRAHLKDGDWPRPGVSRIVIVNRHLEYALTWYGLAATLIGVYLAFAWARLRQGRPQSEG